MREFPLLTRPRCSSSVARVVFKGKNAGVFERGGESEIRAQVQNVVVTRFSARVASEESAVSLQNRHQYAYFTSAYIILTPLSSIEA